MRLRRRFSNSQVAFGQFIRNVHRWAAHLMVVAVFLHLVRVFYAGAYRPPRQFNWVIGVVLLPLTLLLSFTGYLLPWDQLAFWAVTVGTNVAAYSPGVGGGLQRVLLGGPEIAGATLLRFYVLHIYVLPGLLTVVLAIHIWRVRKDGFAMAVSFESCRAKRRLVAAATVLRSSYIPALVGDVTVASVGPAPALYRGSGAGRVGQSDDLGELGKTMRVVGNCERSDEVVLKARLGSGLDFLDLAHDPLDLIAGFAAQQSHDGTSTRSVPCGLDALGRTIGDHPEDHGVYRIDPTSKRPGQDNFVEGVDANVVHEQASP